MITLRYSFVNKGFLLLLSKGGRVERVPHWDLNFQSDRIKMVSVEAEGDSQVVGHRSVGKTVVV